MSSGLAVDGVTGKEVVTPVGVIRPIFWVEYSVNHRFPSGPLAMPPGLSAVVRDSSGVWSGVMAGMRPITFVTLSVNHRAPAGPETMCVGLAVALASAFVRIAPLESMRPTIDGDWATNHIAPSVPAAIPYGNEAPPPPGSGACSVCFPSTVIRPISRALSSVNHTAPSGPAAIENGPDKAESVG